MRVVICQGLTVFYLLPVEEEIIEDRQCGFRRNGSITDHVFGFVRYLRKKGNTMRQCIEFKEAHDSVRWKVFYNILIGLVSP